MKTATAFSGLFKFFYLTLFLAQSLQSLGQHEIKLIDSSQADCSFRGLSVVTDKIVWVSGSKGTVGKSLDGGQTWTWMKVPGFSTSDFRDIEAFDKNRAVIMASGTPAVILKTVDGGQTWKLVFKDDRPEMFLDAMDFWDDKKGVVVGDPVNDHFVLLNTMNGGESWEAVDEFYCPISLDSEAVFAASGTSLRCFDEFNKTMVSFASGGKHSRLFTSFFPFKAVVSDSEEYKMPWIVQNIEIAHGFSSMGAFSLSGYIHPKRNTNLLCITGGNYLSDSLQGANQWASAWYTQCYGREDTIWLGLKSGFDVLGYRSCVEAIKKNMLLACGTSGVDLCMLEDSNKRWVTISTKGFHVVRKAKKGKAVFLAGGKGRIGKLIY